MDPTRAPTSRRGEYALILGLLLAFYIVFVDVTNWGLLWEDPAYLTAPQMQAQAWIWLANFAVAGISSLLILVGILLAPDHRWDR